MYRPGPADDSRTGLLKPQRALWLTNSSGLTLDGGSFSVLEEETSRAKAFSILRHGPGFERQFQADERTAARHARPHPARRDEARKRIREKIRNEDSSSRAVTVEYPVRSGYALRSAVQPVETTAGWMRFRFRPVMR